MIVGGDLGDGLLVLDLGLFGLARGDLFRSGLLLGQLRGERCLALTYGDSFPKEIVDVVDAIIRGDQSRWGDVLEGFVLLSKVLHVVKEKLRGFRPFAVLFHLDRVQKGRDVALHKSQALALQLLLEELRRCWGSFWHVLKIKKRIIN